MDNKLDDILKRLESIERRLISETKAKDDIFLDTQQLAKRWSMNTRSVHNMRFDGTGPSYIQPGGRNGKVLYRLDEILKYENETRKNPADKN